MDIRECLKPAIDKKGYKCGFVANEAGLTDQQLSDIMGKRRRLEANEFMEICRAIKMSPDEVMKCGNEADKKGA